MENLIQKAIQAITDGKNERAIGLLEGVLEMKGVNVVHQYNKDVITNVDRVLNTIIPDEEKENPGAAGLGPVGRIG